MNALPFETVVIEVNILNYSLTALKKAAYRFADRCTIIFGDRVSDRVQLQFATAGTTPNEALPEVVQGFFREALDYEIREKITAETAPVRNLILAHAFSRTRLSDGAGQ
jgi:His-Xaa-Ser system protein HxsD